MLTEQHGSAYINTLKAATCCGGSRWHREQQDTQARKAGPPPKTLDGVLVASWGQTLTMPILGLRHTHMLSKVCWHQHKTRHSHHSDPSSWPECLKTNQSTLRYVAKKQPKNFLKEHIEGGPSRLPVTGR